MQTLNDTAHKILDISEKLTQTRGFNAFSYKDIQKEVGIKTSSIHYYFPTKQDLALAMVTRLAEASALKLGDIVNEETNGLARIKLFLKTYEVMLDSNKLCLFGMLASDSHGLREDVKMAISQFFHNSERFAQNALETAVIQGDIDEKIDTTALSKQLIASIQGGLLITKVSGDKTYFYDVMTFFMKRLTNDGHHI